MGKGARTRALNAQSNREKKEKAKKDAARRKRNGLIIKLVSAAVAIVLVLAIGLTVFNNVMENNGTRMRAATVAESANYKVNGAVLAYFLNANYQNYLTQYGSLLNVLGLDPSVSLKRQAYSETQTWFDYFASLAEQTVTQYLVFSEAAAEEGISLSEAENAILDQNAQQVDPADAGRGINRDDIREVLGLSALSAKYYNWLIDTLEPDEAAIEKAYDEDPKAYQSVDYQSYTLNYADPDASSSSSSTTSSVTMPREEAEKLANELAGCKDKDAFADWVVDYIKRASATPPTDESIAAVPDNILTLGASYVADSDSSAWLFSAKAGETKVMENETQHSFTVYRLEREAARDEGRTVNVRHVLVATQAEADEVLAAYEAGEKTPESFGLLALEYSTDGGSSISGGLYRNVRQGQMVEAFDEWCFDESRTEGETGIVQTDYGYHVMLFCGESLTAWQADVRDALVNEAYEQRYTELTEQYPVTCHPETYDTIPM